MCRLFFSKATEACRLQLLQQLMKGLLKAAVSLFWADTCGLYVKMIHDDKLKIYGLVRVLIDR